MPLAAVDVLRKYVSPPPAKLAVGTSLTKVPLPAVELPLNIVRPPSALPAVPPLLMKVPLLALAVLKNCVWPPNIPKVALPLFVNNRGASGSRAVGEKHLTDVAGTINGSHEVLCGPRIVRDAHAANGKSQSRVGGDGVGIHGGRRERDAVDLSIRRD